MENSIEKEEGWKKAPINTCKGAVIGLGAILPGISGGVLCVICGIYEPMMSFFANPVKKDG